MQFKHPVARVLTLGVVCIAATAIPAMAGFEQDFDISSDELVINNLIGTVEIEGHNGSGFEVSVEVEGDDGDRDTITIREKAGELSVVFPSGEKNFVYPRMGNGHTTFSKKSRSGSWLSQVLGEILGSDKISVRGSGRGLEVWADIHVSVPEGGTLRVNHGVGTIEASSVEGELSLYNRSGKIEATNIDGPLIADTGSGGVTLSNISGNLLVDTGSGSVSVDGCDCESLNIDTGSGGVTVENVDSDEILIDTGSGKVRASEIRTSSANIDTGSGSIRLELEQMGSGDYRLDTGSGSITLALPEGASADVDASTGSGGIHLDLEDGVNIRHKEKDEMTFTVGGGNSTVTLDTGSGSINIVEND